MFCLARSPSTRPAPSPSETRVSVSGRAGPGDSARGSDTATPPHVRPRRPQRRDTGIFHGGRDKQTGRDAFARAPRHNYCRTCYDAGVLLLCCPTLACVRRIACSCGFGCGTRNAERGGGFRDGVMGRCQQQAAAGAGGGRAAPASGGEWHHGGPYWARSEMMT